MPAQVENVDRQRERARAGAWASDVPSGVGTVAVSRTARARTKGQRRGASAARRLAGDPFRLASTRDLIQRTLAEDVGRGDVTTETTIGPERAGTAEFVAREDMVVAGLPLVAMIYAELFGKPISQRRSGTGVMGLGHGRRV